MPARFVHAIRHVHFEDLGSLAAPLREAGYDIRYIEAAADDMGVLDPLAADVLVVLGGPIGAYETEAYPVVAQEIDLLRRRLSAGRPMLGICLGAQLMAAALGAAVYPGPAKEIGWSALSLTEAGRGGPLAALEGVPVLHWHGDTFDLPDGCERLASTAICRQQAFSRGPDALALQFHPEALASQLEHWLIGHACELAQAGIAPESLRSGVRSHGSRLEAAAAVMIGRWLEGLDR